MSWVRASESSRPTDAGSSHHVTFSNLRKRLDVGLVLAVVLTVFAFAPLLHPDFFQSHSGFLSVFNLFDLESNLWRDWGWAPTVGRGFDLLRGEGQMPYVLAEFFRWWGLGGVQAIKAVYVLGFIASGLGVYVLGKRLYGPQAGLVAATVYVYLPYHLSTVYVRGAFAEAWAFVLYPLILLCWEEYMRKRAPLWAALGVVLQAALTSVNAGLALLYALFLFAYVLLLGPSLRVKARALLLLAAGLGVGALPLLPVAMRHGLSVEATGDFAAHFVYPFQLLSAKWGHGASTPDWTDTLPLQLGLVATGLTLLAAVQSVVSSDAEVALRRRTAFFVSAAAILALSMLHPAWGFWRVSRLSVLLRYPWQVLAFAGLAMSLASAGLVGLVRQLARFQWQAVLISLVVLGSYNYLTPRFTEAQVGGAPVAILGEEVALLTYQREGPLLHGATLRLTLHWQSLASMETDYTVFVHVVDQEDTIWGQRDAMPLDGERPTTSWELGEIIEDTYEVKIDADGPREGYVIHVGMYAPGTGQRLPVSRGGTVVILE